MRFRTYKDLEGHVIIHKKRTRTARLNMPRCQGMTKRGTPCSLTVTTAATTSLCHLHRPRDECSICLDSISPSTIHHIGCQGDHVFHKACINTWFLDHDSCPMCRSKVINPLPILPDFQDFALPPPPPDLFRSIASFVHMSLQDDPTMRVSLYFDLETGAMDDAIFWNSTDNDNDSDSDVVAYIFVDGVQRCVLYRWW